MDVITAAAAMTAAIANSERQIPEEPLGPPPKRLRLPCDLSTVKWNNCAQMTPGSLAVVQALPTLQGSIRASGASSTSRIHPPTPTASSAPPINLCPLCGNAAFKKGGLPQEVDIVARGQVGGVVAAGTGRYKIRKEARKDNRLAAWYSRFGYRGPLYCKACSESFRSHLINRKSRPRCGCTWNTPCAHCRLILDGFVGMRVEEVFAKFEAHKQQRQANKRRNAARSAPPVVKSTSVL